MTSGGRHRRRGSRGSSERAERRAHALERLAADNRNLGAELQDLLDQGEIDLESVMLSEAIWLSLHESARAGQPDGAASSVVPFAVEESNALWSADSTACA